MNETVLSQILPEDDVNSHRPLAFFGLKAHKSPDSIRTWVKWCKRQGFGGFNMIIDSECDGRANDPWIAMVLDAYETALEAARSEGLEVWIFDDWGYPSGTAGGLVCTEDAYRLKKLVISRDCRLEAGEEVSFTVPQRVVAGGIISKEGYQRLELSSGALLRYTAQSADERMIIVSWDYDDHMAKSLCKSWPGDPAMSCIDMLNPEAVDRFIEVMHERYYSRFSKYFGTVIKGFFYDEPYLSFPFPWTERLPDEFMVKKGYNLVEILPLLMAQAHEPSGNVKKYTDDYFDVWTGMAAEYFYGRLAHWCSEHGVELSGHMDLDHHLNTLSTISGHFYRNMEHNTRPAVDVIWAQIDPGEFTDFPRYAGSVKRLLGRDHATSETFAGMGQRLHGDLMRYITDHQIIRGIDDFHLMFSSNSSDDKTDKSPQMPDHFLQKPFGRMIYDRIAVSSTIASLGRPASSCALYMPDYDLHRAQMAISGITVNNAEKFPWEWVNDIARKLAYIPIDFDYIWDGALLRLDLAVGGILTGSGTVIRTIVLPPDCTLADTVIEKLKAFHRAGGKLVSVFRPHPALEMESVLCADLSSLEDYVDRTISVISTGNISLCTRVCESKRIFMLLNESAEPADAQISIDGTGSLYELPLNGGGPAPISCSGPFRFSVRFEGCDLKVFVVGQALQLSAPRLIEDENGICPVNWMVELPDGQTVSLNGSHWPEWAKLGYPNYSGAMKYTAEFIWKSEADNAWLRIPELHYHAIVRVDGKEAGRIAYRPYTLLLSGLTEGRHLLEIWVYNTGANEVCGTLETEKKRYAKRFAHMSAHDRKWLKSGITGPVTLFPAVKG